MRDRPATRAAVEALHLKVDKMPGEYVAESLLNSFAGRNWRVEESCCRVPLLLET